MRLKYVVLGLAVAWCGSHAIAQTAVPDVYGARRAGGEAFDLYGYGPDVTSRMGKKRMERGALRGHYHARYVGRTIRIEAEKEETRYEAVRYDKPDSARQSVLDPASAGGGMLAGGAPAMITRSLAAVNDPMLTARLGRRMPIGTTRNVPGMGLGTMGMAAGTHASRAGMVGGTAPGGALSQGAGARPALP
ncbi:hypothetical protein [Burkholderia stagnalis]|uniref:hypothetical protein n=1 Tax=Burkholderia stagnalis TaxID=1503054 RepID=UPI00075A8279|nr:hypothetical protein [Burkholderia stagnalis]KVO52034.1 hypothetical protein WT18_03045 [Burkholderia stagnalis]KWH83097.1 hypothetical protein WT66_08895 [Burkholderia stagnalis]